MLAEETSPWVRDKGLYCLQDNEQRELDGCLVLLLLQFSRGHADGPGRMPHVLTGTPKLRETRIFSIGLQASLCNFCPSKYIQNATSPFTSIAQGGTVPPMDYYKSTRVSKWPLSSHPLSSCRRWSAALSYLITPCSNFSSFHFTQSHFNFLRSSTCSGPCYFSVPVSHYSAVSLSLLQDLWLPCCLWTPQACSCTGTPAWNVLPQEIHVSHVRTNYRSLLRFHLLSKVLPGHQISNCSLWLQISCAFTFAIETASYTIWEI